MDHFNENSELEVRSRKRSNNASSYKRNVIKKSRVCGAGYTNHRGKPVKALQMGLGCRCNRHCFNLIDDDEAIELFQNYLQLETKNEQDLFLQQNIEKVNVARRSNKQLPACLEGQSHSNRDCDSTLRPTSPTPSGGPENQTDSPLQTNRKTRIRGASYRYFIPTKAAGKVKVCKTAYQNIFAVTSERLRRLCNLLKVGKLPSDKRGKHPCKNAISGEVCLQIVDHINSFPQKVSHYSSKEVRYLDAKLDVKKMHNLFQQKYPDTTVKYEFYLKIFNERFNLSFGRPQVDTCCTCELLEVKIKSPSLNEVAKRCAEAELMIHKRRCQKFYHKLREVTKLCDHNDSNYDESILGIAIDYMMNVSLPQIPIQEVFYLRQLTINIFCITNLKTNSSKFYIYHEGVAGKSPNEVTSFINDYINNHVPENVKNLFIFSDGCGGQNKNNTLLRYFAALVEIGRFLKIEQIYPIRGHSFLPCDRAFGWIKRNLKKYDRVYDIQKLSTIILNSHKNFTVKLIQQNDVLKFKNWWQQFYKKTCLSVCSYGRSVPKNKKVTFHISKYNHFIHKSDNVGIVTCKEFIDGLSTFSFALRLPIRNCSQELIHLPTEKAYIDKRPINEKKIADILKLLPYVPEENQTFYEDIKRWPTCTGSESDDETFD